jgi:hypothetical protein
MKFNAKTLMKSNPTFDINTKMKPVDIDFSIKGDMNANLGELSVHISRVPINMRIPFLRRSLGEIEVGSLGEVDVNFEPFALNVQGSSMDINGTIGKDGINGEMKGKVGCETEMDIKATGSGKVGTFQIDLENKD